MSELLSPGIAYGCFELLDIISVTSMPLAAARGLGKLGVVNSKHVTACALALRWVEVNDSGHLVPTDRGQAVRDITLTEHRLRRAILDLTETSNPPWVQNARFGRRRLLQYAPSEITQLCAEAGLTVSSDADVVAFWDELAARARGLHDVRLNEIGREGERLTLRYEENRTKIMPRWIALDSNEDGYDVLSRMTSTDSTHLCIEVKATQQSMRGWFYLTRHEWDEAQTLLNYRVHLWDLTPDTARLAILDIEAISNHLSCDQGSGRWDTVRVPFAAFEDQFTLVSSTRVK